MHIGIFQNLKALLGLDMWLSGRVLAYDVWGTEFNLQYCKKTKNQTINGIMMFTTIKQKNSLVDKLV
jgi:hypothetical protein